MSLIKILFKDIYYSQDCRKKHDVLPDKENFDFQETLFNTSNNLEMGYEFQKYDGHFNDMNVKEIHFSIYELCCIER